MALLGACLWIHVVSGMLPFQGREGSRGQEPVLTPCLPDWLFHAPLTVEDGTVWTR